MQTAYRTYWIRELQQPRSFHSGPVRRGATDKTTRPGPSSRQEEFNGESDESGADGGIGSYNSPGRGRGETAKRLGRSPSTPTQGRQRGASRGFSLAVSTTRGGPRPSTSPHNHTHRRWGNIRGRGVATDRGSMGDNRIPITRGSIRGVRTRVGAPNYGGSEWSLGSSP